MLKKFKISHKIFNLSLCFALLSAILLSVADFDAKCDDLRQNVLRLHIIANSDEAIDQEVKLKIRDEILAKSGDLFLDVNDLDSAKKIAQDKCDEFSLIANQVLKENGFSYKATAKIDKAHFETREYDDFTLPAGIYDSLIITLGEAKGKNWWCVIFPEICLPTASNGDLLDTVKEDSVKIAKNDDEYIARFKIVEIYEKIKNFLK